MAEPKTVDTRPMVMPIEPGTYFYCACGRSSNQPFCDGSHQTVGLLPIRFEIDEPATVAVCMCRTSGNQPFCDGSHNRL
jgi:CDGSH-type Zn-finger protein